MYGNIQSSNLYTPEVEAVIAGGVTPAYNVFPFSGVYRDLSGLLADPNSDFANNVQNAARGAMAGLVHNGNPETLTSDVLFYGRQIEATHQLEREQQESELLRKHKAEQPGEEDLSKKVAKAASKAEDTASQEAASDVAEHKAEQAQDAEHEKISESHIVEQEAAISHAKPSLNPEASSTVAAIGKTLGQLIKDEFIINVPIEAVNSITPTALPSSLNMAHNVALAAFHLHF